MEINKCKKKKERLRLEGNLSSVYFCCKELAELYFNAERYEEALIEYNEMKQISVETGSKIDVGRADRMIGEVYCEKGEFNKAIAHQKNHLKISREENDNVEEQRALATLGRTYFLLAESILDHSSEVRLNALNEAKNFYMKSLDICHELTEGKVSSKQRMEMTCRLFLNIGLVLDCQNQYDDAINHMLKAVSICKNLDLWEDLFRTYSALGSVYQKHCNRQEALKTYDLALNVAERLSNKTQLSCEILNQKAEVLLDLPDLRGARQTFFRAYKLKPCSELLRNEIEWKLRTVAAMCEFEDKLTELPPENSFAERKKLYENMGDAASELSNYGLALTYYHLMLECVQKCGSPIKDLIESYISLAQTYKDNNQLSESLKYFKKELELEEECSPEACKTLMNIAEIHQFCGENEEMLVAFYRAKVIAFECNDIKLKKAVLSAYSDALVGLNRISEAEEIKRELNNLQLNILVESSDEEEDNKRQFGANICIDNLSDEEVDVTKKAKLSRSRARKKGHLEKRNEKGETPLHVAAINGNASLVKRLIEQGHRVDVKDYSGWTPLHEACNHGHKEVVKILLDNKAPVNDRGGAHCDGVTPLLDAACNGSLDVIELLLSYGASPLMRTNSGETVLDCLSSWRERRYAEVGVDLDSITSAHYDSVYTNLKQILENAGQKVPKKDLSEQKGQNSNGSFITDLPSSSFQHTSAREAKQRHQEKRESTAEDYKSTIKALRRKSSSEKLMPSRNSKVSIPALLAEDETVGDNWLEMDVDSYRPNKKRRTDEFLLDRRNVETSLRSKRKPSISSYASDEDDSTTASENLDVIEDNSNDDHIALMISEIEESSSSSQRNNSFSGEMYRERFKEITNIRKKQSSLLSAGIVKEKIPKSISNNQRSLNQQMSDNPSFTQQPIFTCIKVKIEDKSVVVPVPQNSVDSLTISWLAKEASERYRSLEGGSEPILRLEMEDGGLLVGSDPLAILIGISQIRAHVISWNVLSLTGLYKEACDNSNTPVDSELNEILEACQATSSALFEHLYLQKKQLVPIFQTLAHHQPLQVLSVAGNNISDNLITELAECVAKLSQLRSLDLSNINITTKGLEIFCQVVKKHSALQRLEKLKLGYNPLGDCLRPLAELVSSVPRLRYLALPSIGITSHSFSMFIQFTLECIEVLDLSYNDIGGEGLTDILGRLEAQTIVDLRLSATGSQTVREIGFYLQHNSPLSLRSLDLSYCQATDLEIDCLIKGVNMCKHLEKLVLDGLGPACIKINDLLVKELSVCGTKIITDVNLPEQLKKLSLTSSSPGIPVMKGPFGLCILKT